MSGVRVIYKYNHRAPERLIVKGANPKLVHVGMSDGRLSAWVEHDEPDGGSHVVGTIHVVGTGIPFEPGKADHFGTFFDAPFVWHVYVTPPEED